MKKLITIAGALIVLALSSCFWAKEYGMKTIEYEWQRPELQHRGGNGSLILSLTASQQEYELTHWGEDVAPDRRNKDSRTLPVPSWPLSITFPDGTIQTAQTNDEGEAAVALPDDPGRYRPFTFVVVVRTRVGENDVEHQIAADRPSLDLLPPETREWMDSLVAEVRSAWEKVETKRETYNAKIAPFQARYDKVYVPKPLCAVYGDIVNKTQDALFVVGTADCVDRRIQYMPGTFYETRLYVVRGWQAGPRCLREWPDSIGCHPNSGGFVYYRGTTTVTNARGGQGEVPLYLPDPPASPKAERDAFAALRRAEERWKGPVVEAEERYVAVQKAYKEAMPTDPYHLGTKSTQEGQ